MRLFNHFFLALLLILTFAVQTAFSADIELFGTTGKIQGVVRDDKGGLLIEARVEIERSVCYIKCSCWHIFRKMFLCRL